MEHHVFLFLIGTWRDGGVFFGGGRGEKKNSSLVWKYMFTDPINRLQASEFENNIYVVSYGRLNFQFLLKCQVLESPCAAQNIPTCLIIFYVIKKHLLKRFRVYKIFFVKNYTVKKIYMYIYVNITNIFCFIRKFFAR